jgi:SH3-like domain-containing protein
MLQLLYLFIFTVHHALSQPLQADCPRFVSIRSKAVNLHVGPGLTYPVRWTYIRQYLPVEIIAVFDMWRRVRDIEGTEGWIHKSLLSGRRYIFVKKNNLKLFRSPNAESRVIAFLQEGVLAKVKECQDQWCYIKVSSPEGSYSGWVDRKEIWGVYPKETKF